MIFNTRLLAHHISHTPFGAHVSVVPVSYLRDMDHQDDLENKMIRVIVLNCTLGSTTNTMRVTSMSQYGRAKGKSQANQTQYNRFFLLADYDHPPATCALILRQGRETGTLLRMTNGETFVGSQYVIFEPNLSTQTLGDTIPILSIHSGTPLIPLQPTDDIKSTEDTMHFPTTAGAAKYFILKNKEVKLKRVTLVSDPSCSGIQCDRQKSKNECTCVHLTGGNSLVYRFDVQIPVSSSVDKSGYITVFGFRSLRTCSIFFRNFNDHENEITRDQETEAQPKYRCRIAKIVEHINANGGWTIIGWMVLGMVQDAQGSDKVENLHCTVHLSYLMPSNYYTTIKYSRAFFNLQITNNFINQDENEQDQQHQDENQQDPKQTNKAKRNK